MRSFRGNKANLPSKRCTVCGLTMSWRKHWAKNWDALLYCSDRCRKSAKDKTLRSEKQSIVKDPKSIEHPNAE
jgi:hypothetical protein